MSGTDSKDVNPEQVFYWLKGEFFKRYWHLAIALFLLNLIALLIGWPLLQYKFTEYLDAKLQADGARIDEVRIQTASAEREANTAVARANEATKMINEINKDAIRTQNEVSQLKAQLHETQRQALQLPEFTQRLTDARKALDDYDRLSAELRAKNGWVHLGMIVPYFGSVLPEGFVWADGKERWPTENWVPPHLQGIQVPNLNGRFLRGATDGASVGELGGTDEIPAQTITKSGGHSHALPDHQHSLQDHTGPIALGPEIPAGTPYAVMDDHANRNLKWGDNDKGTNLPKHHLRVDGDANDSGQHRHSLPATTLGLTQNSQTPLGGEHTHPIDAIPFVPSYISVNYIIRVR